MSGTPSTITRTCYKDGPRSKKLGGRKRRRRQRPKPRRLPRRRRGRRWRRSTKTWTSRWQMSPMRSRNPSPARNARQTRRRCVVPLPFPAPLHDILPSLPGTFLLTLVIRFPDTPTVGFCQETKDQAYHFVHQGGQRNAQFSVILQGNACQVGFEEQIQEGSHQGTRAHSRGEAHAQRGTV